MEWIRELLTDWEKWLNPYRNIPEKQIFTAAVLCVFLAVFVRFSMEIPESVALRWVWSFLYLYGAMRDVPWPDVRKPPYSFGAVLVHPGGF